MIVNFSSAGLCLGAFVARTKVILGDNLAGIYLHGSAVMGCFNPGKSDLDLIVVVNEPVSDTVKKDFMDMVVELNESAPAKGIELSVVTRNVCDPFVYPTPFELHFSVAHLGWYRNDPDDYIQKMNGTDKDLAAHFTIIRSRGQCLYGAPMDEIFSPIPKYDYMDSIRNDIAEAVDEIGDNTMYLTLNLARVLAYKEEDLVLSKKEGGDWALINTPAQFHPLIQHAMSEYVGSEDIVYDTELAIQYAAYMLDRINRS
jgi:streptomycin 3"-adenylyltransferase